MRKIIAALFSLLLLSSCMSIKRVDNAVNDRFKHIQHLQSVQSFSIVNPVPGGKLSDTKQTKSTSIPALFYWKFSKTYHTDINTVVPLNLFSKYADDYAKTTRLKDKVGERKVELEVISIPKAFDATFTNTTIYLLLAAANSQTNVAQTEAVSLKVAYKILDNAQLAQQGEIEVSYADLEKYSTQLNLSKQSNVDPATFLKGYLELYENIVYLQSKVFIDKLSTQLKPVSNEN